jgi:glycosyltransferase involved in cell wall biosynthesis
MHVTTFSVVIETENLAMGGVADLERCLDSLDKQTLDIRKANEVWIMVGGHLDPADAELIRTQYPWTTIHQANGELSYLGAKKMGAAISSGEIVLFADSDVAYDPRWLALILDERSKHPQKDIVTSDSRVAIDSSYGFVMASVWIMHIKRLGGPPAESRGFPLNNVSVDRTTMIAVEHDEGLPLYRGFLGFWQKRLRARGVRFYRIPRVMGLHLPPQGLAEWFYRMLIFGADYVAAANYQQAADGTVTARPSVVRRAVAAMKWAGYRWVMAVVHSSRLIAEDWTRMRYVPLGLPIALFSLILITAGSVITVFNSRFLYDRVVAFENSD